MTPTPDLSFWLSFAGNLAIFSSIAIAVAGLLGSKPGRRPRTRRLIWQTCFASLSLMLLAELMGARGIAGRWLQDRPSRSPHFVVRGNLTPTAGAEPSSPSPARTETLEEPASVPSSSPKGTAWWPGALWVAGTSLLVLWALAARLVLAWLCRQRRALTDPALLRKLTTVRERLGVCRPVRIIESPSLNGPVALGVRGWIIALPSGFGERFGSAEQEVMLAHELAHLAASDPLWHAGADLVVAAFWWHPAIWWARRQFHSASESAADEASLVVENGPLTLAECLIQLAARMPARTPWGWTAMAGSGFRSGLGQRVNHLAGLAGGNASFAGPGWAGFRALTSATLLTAATVTTAAWVVPSSATSPAPMRLLLASAIQSPGQPTERRVPAQQTPAVPVGALDRPPLLAATDETQPTVPPPVAGNGVESASSPTSKIALAEAAAVPAAPPTGPEPHDATQDVPSSRNSPGQDQLFTRSYKADPRAIIQNLGLAREHGLSATSGDTNQPSSARLRAYFQALGVNWNDDTPLGDAHHKALFFNERTGYLLARATMSDLDVIDAGIQVLNQAPPQVEIEAKIVEVDEGSPAALDLKSINITTDKLPFTNSIAPVPAQGLIPGAQSAALTNATVRIASTGTITGILTDPQFRRVVKALEQQPGTDVLSAPKVTTVSGRQAQISVTDLRTVVADINPDAITAAGKKSSGDGPNSAYVTQQLSTGPVLDVVPTVSADNRTVDLAITFTVTEFLGYDAPGKADRVRVVVQGKEQVVERPHPRLRVHRFTTNARVADGQSLLIGGSTFEDQIRTKDQVPVLGDLPLVGKLFRRDQTQTKRKHLILLVTTTVIDPTGTPYHPQATTPSLDAR